MLVCSAVARIKVLSLGPLPEAQRHRVRCVIILLCVEVLVVCTALGSHPVSVDNRVKSSRYTCGRPALHGTDYCDDEFCLLCAAGAIIKARHKSKEKR